LTFSLVRFFYIQTKEMNKKSIFTQKEFDTIRMKFNCKILISMAIGCLTASSLHAIEVDFTYTTGCLGTPTTLSSTTTPADSILTLLWDLDADGQFDDGSGETIVHLFTSIGNHPVGLQVMALNGEIKAIYKDVPVSGVQASFSFSGGCMGQPILFTDLSATFADFITNWSWNFGDGSAPVAVQNPQHTFTATGTFTVTLTVTTGLGCSDSLPNEIVMQPPPEFDLIFTGDTAAFYNDTLLVEVTGAFDSVVWNGTITSDYFMITQAGDYEVSVYLDGCFASQAFTIRNHPTTSAGIMTLFTPNGDGYNDLWVIRDMEALGSCSVKIFNSWGTMVYENTDYQNTWDGNSDNGELPSGPYYYVVKFADGEIFKGTVNILR